MTTRLSLLFAKSLIQVQLHSALALVRFTLRILTKCCRMTPSELKGPKCGTNRVSAGEDYSA